MRTHYGGIASWAVMVTVMAAPVAAQTASAPSVKSFDELPSVIQQLDTLEVTDISGQKVKGQLRQLTNSTIEVFTRDSATRTFDRANVQRIVLSDSISDGAQKGALGGVIPLLIAGLMINGGCRNEGGSCLGVVFGLAGLGAGIGAGLGAAADIAVRELVYDQQSGTRNTITQGRGPRMSVQVTSTHASFGLNYGW
jgi:hypothetical protein